MKKKKTYIIFIRSLLFFLLFFCPKLNAQEQTTNTFEYAEENQQCLKCHGHKYYNYFNTWIEKMVRERMNPYFVIDSAEFYQSNHRNFSCVDCHSSDYRKFPHSGELRMEPRAGCMDCHGGDETYAKFNFEQIDEEFRNSVHFSKYSDEFTCWMCHNPHSYKTSARNNENLQKTIEYDNNICLSCHADISEYQLLTTLENPNILETHDWLPNQVLHFKNVRCIECHTQISNNVLVAHNVQPKEKAVKLCTECHSQNSILKETLYKYQKEISGKFEFSQREDFPHLIGGNRIYLLNLVSIIIFLITLGGVGIHIILRLINKST